MSVVYQVGSDEDGNLCGSWVCVLVVSYCSVLIMIGFIMMVFYIQFDGMYLIIFNLWELWEVLLIVF